MEEEEPGNNAGLVFNTTVEFLKRIGGSSKEDRSGDSHRPVDMEIDPPARASDDSDQDRHFSDIDSDEELSNKVFESAFLHKIYVKMKIQVFLNFS